MTEQNEHRCCCCSRREAVDLSKSKLIVVTSKVSLFTLSLPGDQDRISPYNMNYNIKTSDENNGKYQQGVYQWIQYQILKTHIMRTLWQLVTRITDEILGVEGFKFHLCRIPKQQISFNTGLEQDNRKSLCFKTIFIGLSMTNFLNNQSKANTAERKCKIRSMLTLKLPKSIC